MLSSSVLVASTLALLQSTFTSAAPTSTSPSLPTVDLGYVKQQASSYNKDIDVFNFTNVAFAQPPLGDLRFAAPKPPLKQNGVQNGGSVPKRCLQAWPKWLAKNLIGIDDYEYPYQTEDCLYLDVFVPQKVFNRRNQPSNRAPVVVWIYGGGFVIGSKADDNPSGLIAKGQSDTSSDGVIYVALNYRLGHLGFLGGSTYNSQGGQSNLGLLDQKMAVDWVRNNIEKFGGDPARITLLGESGGALSVGYQITEPFAGNCSKPPIQHAIFQSPAGLSLPTNDFQNNIYNQWLKTLNVTNLTAARKLNTTTIYNANHALVQAWPTGQYLLSPAVDGVYVKDVYTKDLLAGNFDSSITVMTAYNYGEGSIFLPSDPQLLNNFTALVKSYVPQISPKQLAQVTNSIYPPPGPQTPYYDARGRTVQFIGDVDFDCQAVAIEQAVKNKGYAYKFSIPSNKGTGYHTQDLAYTFYNGGDLPAKNVAIAMQSAIVNFAVYGNPNHAGTIKPSVPVYGSGHQMLNLTTNGFQLIKDAAAGPRCDFWNGT